MAIIVDKRDEARAIMGDDGQGGSIKIPSFLIGNKDGKVLKEAIHQMEEKLIKNLSNEDWVADVEDRDNHESRNFVNTVKNRKQYRKKGHQVII